MARGETSFRVLEHLFAIVFLLEFIYRVAVFKLAFFKNGFNVFDAFLVFASSVELYILEPLNVEGVSNLTILRFLRLGRFARTFRAIRTMQMFKGLRVLLKSCSSCLTSLMWACVILIGCMLMGGLLMVTLAEGIIAEESGDLEMRLWTWKHYGTAVRAIYTMFEVTLSGCWPNYVRPLLESETYYLFGFFFIIYVILVVFAVIRVITAIFLKETMDACTADHEIMVTERAHKRETYLAKLKRIFEACDTSGDGSIGEAEFIEMMGDLDVKAIFSGLELEVLRHGDFPPARRRRW